MPRTRRRRASTSALARPRKAAGAGPSSAIASTRPVNEPPIRKRLASSTRTSEPSTSSASSPTIFQSSHWLWSLSEAATASTTTSANACPNAIARRRPANGTRPVGIRSRAGAGGSEPAAALTTESDQTTSPSHTTNAIHTTTASKVMRTPCGAQSGPGLSFSRTEFRVERCTVKRCLYTLLLGTGVGFDFAGTRSARGSARVYQATTSQGGHHGLAQLGSSG